MIFKRMGFIYARYWFMGYDLEGCPQNQARSWLFLNAAWFTCHSDFGLGYEIGILNGKN